MISQPSYSDRKKKAVQDEAIISELQARLKKQECLYSISILDEHKLTIDELLENAIKLFPTGWPEKMVALSFQFDKEVYKTPNFEYLSTLDATRTIHKQEGPLLASCLFKKGYVRDDDEFFTLIISRLTFKMERIRDRQEALAQQQLLDKIYMFAGVGTWEYCMITQKLIWSTVTKEIYGFDKGYEPAAEDVYHLFKGYDKERFKQAGRDAIKSGKPFDIELEVVTANGDLRWIRATGEPEIKRGVCIRFYGICMNVTDRRQAEEARRMSKRRFKSLVQNSSDLIAIIDEAGSYTYLSPAAKRILGVQPDEYIGTNGLKYIHEDDRDRLLDLFSNLNPQEQLKVEPYRVIDSEGNWRWLETTVTNMLDDPAIRGLVTNSRDVTKQRKHEQQIMDSLHEKDMLLAEIHHRVKNNLAVVASLLQLQISGEKNTDVSARLTDSMNRINTMAGIHEQMYRSNSFSKIDFVKNSMLLTSNLLKAFKPDARVSINYQSEPLSLGIVQAIPCSLIINEVITNILKHAFRGRKSGSIIICLTRKKKNGLVEIRIEDNGVGLPNDYRDYVNQSLGMNLIDGLSRQLDAEYTFDSSDGGTTFSLIFKKRELKKSKKEFPLGE